MFIGGLSWPDGEIANHCAWHQYVTHQVLHNWEEIEFQGFLAVAENRWNFSIAIIVKIYKAQNLSTGNHHIQILKCYDWKLCFIKIPNDLCKVIQWGKPPKWDNQGANPQAVVLLYQTSLQNFMLESHFLWHLCCLALVGSVWYQSCRLLMPTLRNTGIHFHCAGPHWYQTTTQAFCFCLTHVLLVLHLELYSVLTARADKFCLFLEVENRSNCVPYLWSHTR